MFKKTEPSRQLSLFDTVSQHLKGKTRDLYTDEDSWHNIFHREVVSRINEDLFAPLFSTENGAPNQSVRILIGMMVIKEGKGISDEELFENARFNLLVRSALGLFNINDSVPSPSTYYLFRQRLGEYLEETGTDLLEECFKGITKGQARSYNVGGKSVRMDSKLIGSNIASCSRYELIHTTLLLFHNSMEKNWWRVLPQEYQESLKLFAREKAADTVYRNGKDEIKEKLERLGILIYYILLYSPGENQEYETLQRVFHEQYNLGSDQRTKLKEGKDVSAKSVQSPHETECTYRTKNEQDIQGYNHNVTETCDKNNDVNLITDLQTEKATATDNGFVEAGIENSQDVLEDKVENVHTDGAYNSEDNQAFMQENGINFYLTGFQGAIPRYRLTREQGGVKCYDTKEDKDVEITITEKGKYRIKTKKNYRYFTDQDIDKQELRRKIEQIPREIANVRNNVEASIYQLAYPLRKDKTKYRGLFKNKIWAILRCTWVNCIRIINFIDKKAKKKEKQQTIDLFFYFLKILTEVKPLRIA